MKLEATQIPYLTGEKFTNELHVSLHSVHPAQASLNRLVFLRDLVKGKKVVHVGCVDHMPLVEERRKQGLWLHDILSSSAAQVVGIDINKEGIAYMQAQGFKDVYHCDIIQDELPEAVRAGKFDYAVLGEMIEHVDNPVAFLSAVRNKFNGSVATLVTTTPNVFRFQNLLGSLRQRERINSDHRYWFSPYTLTKVLSQAGFKDIEIDMVWNTPPQRAVAKLAKIIVGSTWPATKDCLIARAGITGS